MRKRATLFIIGLFVICPVLLIIGLFSGAIGSGVFGDIGLPDWLLVSRPRPELPAEVVAHLLGIPITNSIIGAWLSMLVLVGGSFLITQKMRLIPSRLQSVLELTFEGLIKLCQNFAGEENTRRFFPVVATIFLFVIVNAYMSLLPGFGSIIVTNHEGEIVPLLRGANTDVNMAMALALVSGAFVTYSGFKQLGIRYVGKFFDFSAIFRCFRQMEGGNVYEGITGLLTALINMFAGFLELIGEFVRIVSFTFRLFGNMVAGEILLMVMFFLVPWIAIFPFYGLELLVGLIQAVIFAGLTLIFASLAVASHHEQAES